MAQPNFLFPDMRELYDGLPPDIQEVFAWLYEKMRVDSPLQMTMIHGAMMAEAIANPTATFWEVAAAAKNHLDVS